MAHRFFTSSPFNTSYQIKELNLPFTFIMLVGFFGNLVRIVITLLLWDGWGSFWHGLYV